MTQTAFNQGTNPFQLLGMIAGTQNGATKGSSLFGKSGLMNTGGVSFDALLNMQQSNINSIEDIKKLLNSGDLPQTSQSTSGNSSLSYLLSLQSGDIEGQAINPELLSIAEKLVQNTKAMFTAPNASISTQSNSDLSANEDLIFLFNAPTSIYGTTPKNLEAENALQAGNLSTDMLFTLMLEQQNGAANSKSIKNIQDILASNTNDASDIDKKLNGLFSDFISMNNLGEDLQNELQALQDQFASEISNFALIVPVNQTIAKPQSTPMGLENVSLVAIAATQRNANVNNQATNSADILTGNNLANAISNKNTNANIPFLQNIKAGAPVSNDGLAMNDLDASSLPVNGAANKSLFILGKVQTGLSSFKSTLLQNSALVPSQSSAGLNNAALASTNAASSSSGAPISFENIFNAMKGDGSDELFNFDALNVDHINTKADIQSIATKAGSLTTAQQAGQPHSSTQHVMQQISLMASRHQNGDSEMRIKMDPPELGNVTVKIKFGKDGSAQMHLTAERPETLAMLQRDVASLQKTLQEAGLEVSQDSLSFDLQEQGNSDFANSQGNNQGASNTMSQSSSSSGNEDDQNIIETEMTIFVDPETGQQRINMVV